MKKNALIILLITVLILSFSVNLFAFAVEDEDLFPLFPEEINFFQALGIIENDFVADDEITRAEFLSLVMNMLHKDMDLTQIKETVYFKDVKLSHEYFSLISACKTLGIINGYENSNFYPDNIITLNEAITITVNALGYTQYANANGGQYYLIAKKIGMLNNISFSMDTEVYKGLAIKLLYNSLYADLVIISEISANQVNIEIDKTKTLLSEKFHITEYDAIVSDNGFSSLSGNSIDNIDWITLTDYKTHLQIIAKVNKSDIAKYFGYRVKALIQYDTQNDTNTVVGYSINKNVTAKQLNADRILNIDSSYVEYENKEENAKTAKLNFEVENPLIIYNGYHLISYDDSIMKPKDGFVTFIDNDGNDRYEIINIVSFNYNNTYNDPARNVVVSAIDDNNLTDELTNTNNLNLSNEDYIYSFILNDKISSLDDLAEYDVVSVAKAPITYNDKTIYYLVGSSEELSGIPDGKSETSLFFNGKEYELSTSLLQAKPQILDHLNMLNSITIKLDITGKIAYINDGINRSMKNYAFIDHYGYTNDFEPVGLIKLFTLSGKIESFEFAEKVSVNNENNVYVPISEIFALLEKNRGELIVYELNNEKQVNHLQFVQAASTNFEENQDQFVLSNVVSGAAYKTMGGVGVFDTYLFKVYKSKTTKRVLENYSSVAYNGFASGTSYKNVRCYDVGVNGVAKVALIMNELNDGEFTVGSFVGEHSKPCVFQSLVKTIDEEGAICNKIYYYSKGQRVGLLLSNSLTIVNLNGLEVEPSQLSTGDLFVFTKDVTGKINAFGAVYVDSLQNSAQDILYSNTEAYYAAHLYLKGNLIYAGTEAITVRFQSDTQILNYPLVPNKQIIVYSIDKSTGKIKTTSLDKVKTGYKENDMGASVVTYSSLDVIQEMYVYE